MVPIGDEDWKVAVEAVAGIVNGLSDTEIEASVWLENVEPKYILFHGTWSVERMTLQKYIQEQLENPASIASVMKRLESDGLISKPMYTSKGGATYRVHTISKRTANAVFAELWG